MIKWPGISLLWRGEQRKHTCVKTPWVPVYPRPQARCLDSFCQILQYFCSFLQYFFTFVSNYFSICFAYCILIGVRVPVLEIFMEQSERQHRNLVCVSNGLGVLYTLFPCSVSFNSGQLVTALVQYFVCVYLQSVFIRRKQIESPLMEERVLADTKRASGFSQEGNNPSGF